MSEENAFKQKVIQSFLYSGAGNLISKLISVFGLLIVLKLISPEAFGIASIVVAIFAVVQAVTEMGLGVAIVQAEKLTRRQIDSLFWISLILTACIYAVLYFIAPVLAQFFEQAEITDMIRVNGLVVIFFTFYFVPLNILKRELLFKKIVVISNGSLLFSSILMVILAFYGFGAWSIILAEVANKGSQLILAQLFHPHFPKFHFSWSEIRENVSFGVYATGSRLLYNLYSNADYFIVGKIFGTHALGIYALAYKIVSEVVKLLTSNINEVAYPAFSRLQTDMPRLRLYFFTLARASMQINAVILIVIGIYIDDILTFAGYTEWLNSVDLVRILAIAAILRSVSPLVPQLLNAVGKAKLNFYYSLSNAIIMPIAFLFGAQYGLSGVGWAWVAGYPVVVLLLFYFGSQVLEISVFKFIRDAFSNFWMLLLVLAFGVILQTQILVIFSSSYVANMIIGILLILLLSVLLIYKRERETIAVIRGKSR